MLKADVQIPERLNVDNIVTTLRSWLWFWKVYYDTYQAR